MEGEQEQGEGKLGNLALKIQEYKENPTNKGKQAIMDNMYVVALKNSLEDLVREYNDSWRYTDQQLREDFKTKFEVKILSKGLIINDEEAMKTSLDELYTTFTQASEPALVQTYKLGFKSSKEFNNTNFEKAIMNDLSKDLGKEKSSLLALREAVPQKQTAPKKAKKQLATSATSVVAPVVAEEEVQKQAKANPGSEVLNAPAMPATQEREQQPAAQVNLKDLTSSNLIVEESEQVYDDYGFYDALEELPDQQKVTLMAKSLVEQVQQVQYASAQQQQEVVPQPQPAVAVEKNQAKEIQAQITGNAGAILYAQGNLQKEVRAKSQQLPEEVAAHVQVDGNLQEVNNKSEMQDQGKPVDNNQEVVAQMQEVALTNPARKNEAPNMPNAQAQVDSQIQLQAVKKEISYDAGDSLDSKTINSTQYTLTKPAESVNDERTVTLMVAPHNNKQAVALRAPRQMGISKPKQSWQVVPKIEEIRVIAGEMQAIKEKIALFKPNFFIEHSNKRIQGGKEDYTTYFMEAIKFTDKEKELFTKILSETKTLRTFQKAVLDYQKTINRTLTIVDYQIIFEDLKKKFCFLK